MKWKFDALRPKTKDSQDIVDGVCAFILAFPSSARAPRAFRLPSVWRLFPGFKCDCYPALQCCDRLGLSLCGAGRELGDQAPFLLEKDANGARLGVEAGLINTSGLAVRDFYAECFCQNMLVRKAADECAVFQQEIMPTMYLVGS
jgi:hypothetical protein